MSLYGYLIKLAMRSNFNSYFEIAMALNILEGDGDQRSSGGLGGKIAQGFEFDQ